MYHWWNFHQAPDGTYSNLYNIKVNGQHIEGETVTAEEFPVTLAVIITKRVICFNGLSTEMKFIYFRKRCLIIWCRQSLKLWWANSHTYLMEMIWNFSWNPSCFLCRTSKTSLEYCWTSICCLKTNPRA